MKQMCPLLRERREREKRKRRGRGSREEFFSQTHKRRGGEERRGGGVWSNAVPKSKKNTALHGALAPLRAIAENSTLLPAEVLCAADAVGGGFGGSLSNLAISCWQFGPVSDWISLAWGASLGSHRWPSCRAASRGH